MSKVSLQLSILEALFYNAFEAIAIVDEKKRVVECNQSMQNLFGYSKDECAGMSILTILPDFFVSHHEILEYYGMKKDKTNISLKVKMIEFAEQEHTIFIFYFDELTNLLALNVEKQRALFEQSKLASMGEMIGAIAHQWRQPLNAVSLLVSEFFYGFKHKDLTLQSVEVIRNEIMAQLHFMSETIDGFRKFFKKEHFKVETSLLKILQEIYELYWAQLNASAITLKLYCLEEGRYKECLAREDVTLSYLIECKPTEIKQALLNIIQNAKDEIARHTSTLLPSQKEIVIILEEKKESVLVRIEDYVAPMQEETLYRIFEPYFTTKEMGTGLGLYITKTILEKNHAANIEVNNIKHTTETGEILDGVAFIITFLKEGVRIMREENI